MDPTLTDPERRVLLSLFSFRGRNTNTVWPSLGAIAERSQLNDQTRVSKLTASLSKKGWLTKKKRGFTGCNEYVLTVPERLTNLDPAAKLEEDAKLGPDTNSNLDSAAKSNLDPAAKYKEQTNEQTKEQGTGDISDERSPKQRVPFQKIVDLYHECLPELPRCEELTEARKGAIRQRWQNNLTELDHWRNFFEYVSGSDFLMGRAEPRPGKRPFRASLEWITKHGNYAKIKEGAYHG